MTKLEKYRRIVKWAQLRYAVAGVLIISQGDVLSKYSRIEEAAFSRYVRPKRDSSGALLFNA